MAGIGKVRIIRWSEPPARTSAYQKRKKQTPWEAVVARLSQRPGEWALIRTSTYRPVYTQKAKHGLEIVTRQYGKNGKRYGTWARFPATSEDENSGDDSTVKGSQTDLTNDSQ